MIKEAYCSFEVAKLLKEKGFDGKCRYYYPNDHTQLISYVDCVQSQMFGNDACIAPTQQMAMAWLREVHKLPINIWYDKEEDTPDDEVWTSEIAVDRSSYILVGSFASYEEACEAALKYSLENLI